MGRQWRLVTFFYSWALLKGQILEHNFCQATFIKRKFFKNAGLSIFYWSLKKNYSIVRLNGQRVGRAFGSKSPSNVHLKGLVDILNCPVKRNEQFESSIFLIKRTLEERFDQNQSEQTVRLNAQCCIQYTVPIVTKQLQWSAFKDAFY